MRVWDAKDISDDFIVDEEPPPAPTTVIDGDAGLEQELDKLEQNEEELQETPEDGIIDDDAPPAEEAEENTEGGEGNEFFSWSCVNSQKLCESSIFSFYYRSSKSRFGRRYY